MSTSQRIDAENGAWQPACRQPKRQETHQWPVARAGVSQISGPSTPRA